MTWVLVSAVPDLLGSFTIDPQHLREFRETLGRQGAWAIGAMGVSFRRFRVGRRRLVADGANADQLARWVLAEFHSDGSGTYGLQLPDLNEQRRVGITNPEAVHSLIDDEALTLAIVTGLLRLAQHARDRAAAGGGLLVHARLIRPSNRNAVEIGHTRQGFGQSRSEFAHDEVPAAESFALIDDLADPGPPLLTTAAALANELAQSFGIAELGQVTPDGRIRSRYWRDTRDDGPLGSWARAAGVEMTTDALEQ
jgi:hypothetical protein